MLRQTGPILAGKAHRGFDLVQGQWIQPADREFALFQQAQNGFTERIVRPQDRQIEL